jgi:predicted naringenin-chalcone synthase
LQLIRKGEAAEILGVSNGRISQLLTSGALHEVPGTKMLDREAVLAFKRSPSVKLRSPAQKVLQTKEAKQGRRSVKERIDALPDDSIPDLQTSRERREHYQAELAKLDVDLKRKELVPAEAVKREAFALAKTIREALVNIPDRVANQLAAETDAQAVHMVLSKEITEALERLADA